jgi:signal transduction histidine kinase
MDTQIESSAHMVVQCADAIYEEVHQLVCQLRPLALDRFGLQDALQDLLEDARKRHPQVRMSLRIQAPLASLEGELATATYRIMQESLTNALRHAKASIIDMQVVLQGSLLQLEVRDNGIGPASDWQESGHFGVIGMHERAQGLGGQLQFEPLTPSGLRVVAVLPFKENTQHV